MKFTSLCPFSLARNNSVLLPLGTKFIKLRTDVWSIEFNIDLTAWRSPWAQDSWSNPKVSIRWASCLSAAALKIKRHLFYIFLFRLILNLIVDTLLKFWKERITLIQPCIQSDLLYQPDQEESSLSGPLPWDWPQLLQEQIHLMHGHARQQRAEQSVLRHGVLRQRPLTKIRIWLVFFTSCIRYEKYWKHFLM